MKKALGVLVLLLLQAGLIYFAAVDIQRFEFAGGHYEVVNSFPRALQAFTQALLTIEALVAVVYIIIWCFCLIFDTNNVPEK